MLSHWNQHPIYTRTDGSYVITMRGYPYHVPADLPEFAALWTQVDAWARSHPDQVEPEPGPPPPTLEEARAARLAEFDRTMADIDADLIRSTTDLVNAMLAPATLADDGSGEGGGTGADELERSRAVFAELRALQAQNRALRARAEAAETVEEARDLEPAVWTRC